MDIIHIFGIVDPPSEFTFPVFYIIIFQTDQSLGPPK